MKSVQVFVLGLVLAGWALLAAASTAFAAPTSLARLGLENPLEAQVETIHYRRHHRHHHHHGRHHHRHPHSHHHHHGHHS